VLSLGVIRGGHASNIIPAEVYIEGTLRSMDPGVREQLLLEVERCLQVARALGGDYTLKIERGYPPLHNHADVVDEIRTTARELLGGEGLGPSQPSMGAEDFSYMTQQCAGAMFRLGVKPADAPARYLHTADFNLDEDALPLGAAMLAATALRLMARTTR
jgi:amidohydrolase